MTEGHHWRRFALMDVMVIVLCCALGMWLVRDTYRTPAVVKLVMGLPIAAVAAVPALLASHRLFRGRREPLLLGERLGLVPAGGVSVVVVLAYLQAPAMVWRIFLTAWFAIQLLCALGSCAYAINAWLEREVAAPRPWTDTLGAVVGALAGGLISLGLLAIMSHVGR